MAGQTLTDFLISFGYIQDQPSARKAIADHTAVEKKATKVNETEAEKRQKVEEKAASRRQRLADEAAKKDVQRNKAVLSDAEKNLVRIESFATGVTRVVGAIGAAFAGSAAFNSIVNTANVFSKLQMESQRTGASPKHIESIIYALGQLGSDKGAARGSLDGFSSYLKNNPGVKDVLAGSGIDASGDDAEIFAQLGKYFNSLNPSVARNLSSTWGIGVDDMLNLEKQPELQQKMKEFGGASMGLDADKAAKEGREFTQAYDKLATDLGNIQKRIDAEFFKPLEHGMRGLSHWLEDNKDQVTSLTLGMEAMGAAVILKVIPAVMRLFGLTAPAWMTLVARLTGTTAAAIGLGASAESTLGAGISSDATTREAQAALNRKLTREANTRTGQGNGFLADTWNWTKQKLGLAPSSPPPPDAGPRGRVAFGRRIGTSHANPEVRDYLRAAAAARGIEPDAAENLFAHEGLNVFDPNRPDRGGDGGSSFGPTQLHYGGINPAMPHAGMGDDFTKATGLDARNSSTWKAQIDFALDHAKKKGWGAWMGRGPAHMGIWDGIGTYKQPSRPAMPAHVEETLRKMTSGPYGALDRDAFATKPLGDTAALHQSITNSTKGDTAFHQNVTVNGATDPRGVADAVKATATRGSRDLLRNLQGAEQ